MIYSAKQNYYDKILIQSKNDPTKIWKTIIIFCIIQRKTKVISFRLDCKFLMALFIPTNYCQNSVQWCSGICFAVGTPRVYSPSQVIPKDFKKWYSQLPCLALSRIQIVWRTSQQACLLCPWTRHLMGCLHLYVADRWWGKAVYLLWWPSLTEDSQTEHEHSCSVYTSSCIMLRTNRSSDEEDCQNLWQFFCKHWL